MRIAIEEIGEDGLDLREELGRPWMDGALSEGRRSAFWAESPTELVIHAERVDDGVLLRGSFSPRLATECRRCLKRVAIDLPVAFMLSFVSHERRGRRDVGIDEDDEASSFDAREADREELHGRTIEVLPFVREQLLLALPMDALCQEDCQGLCEGCGRDRNEGPCGCLSAREEGGRRRPVEASGDPRWEKLKGVKLSN